MLHPKKRSQQGLEEGEQYNCSVQLLNRMVWIKKNCQQGAHAHRSWRHTQAWSPTSVSSKWYFQNLLYESQRVIVSRQFSKIQLCCGSKKANNRCYVLHKELSQCRSSLETFQHSEKMILGFILLQGGKSSKEAGYGNQNEIEICL